MPNADIVVPAAMPFPYIKSPMDKVPDRIVVTVRVDPVQLPMIEAVGFGLNDMYTLS